MPFLPSRSISSFVQPELTMTGPTAPVEEAVVRELYELLKWGPTSANCCPAPTMLSLVTAMRNGTLQGAYLLMAARALGLDCGPMSGLSLHPRNPRLAFDETSRFE